MLTRIVATTLLASLPLSLSAQEYLEFQCYSGALARRIAVHYETAATLPCEVHYYKEAKEEPGEPQVLWRARNTAGYCESKARELADRLNDSGWDCAQVVPSTLR